MVKEWFRQMGVLVIEKDKTVTISHEGKSVSVPKEDIEDVDISSGIKLFDDIKSSLKI
jgi:hypothetical protein